MACPFMLTWMQANWEAASVANLNATNSCGILGGQVSGAYAAASIPVVPIWNASNAVVYGSPPGPQNGFPCYVLTNPGAAAASELDACSMLPSHEERLGSTG